LERERAEPSGLVGGGGLAGSGRRGSRAAWSDAGLHVLLAGGYFSCFALLGGRSLWLLVASVGFLAAALAVRRGRFEVLRAAVAAAVATPSEIAVTSHGAYTYAAPQLGSVPLWLPVGWAFFSLVTFRIADGLAAGWGLPAPRERSRGLKAAFELAVIPAVMGCAVLFWADPVVSTAGLAVTLGLFAALYPGRYTLLVMALSLLFAVPLELCGVAGGEWRWRAPDLAGVPVWVPLGYAFLTLAHHRVALLVAPTLSLDAAWARAPDSGLDGPPRTE